MTQAPSPDPTRTLVLFDMDNTLVDSIALWAQAARSITATLASALNKTTDEVFDLLRQSPDQHRFSDLASAFEWMDNNGLLPPAADAVSRYERNLLKAHIRGVWNTAERQFTTLYDGAFELLEGLKAQGTSIAIFTDAEAAVMIRRLWTLDYNVSRSLPGRKPHDLLNMIDHAYSRPSIDDDEKFLSGCDHNFVLKLKQKTTLWEDRVYKPSPSHAEVICRDFSTAPANALMVGDSYKDGGSARPLGMDFLWYEPGTNHNQDIIDIVLKISDPGWNYGSAHIRSCFNDQCSPTHVIQSLPDILALYNFAAGSSFAATPAPQVARRLEPAMTGIPRRMMGPPTHL